MNSNGLGYCISRVAGRLLEDKKKKEKVAGVGMGYCPFSKIESQYSKLYYGTQQAVLWHTVDSAVLWHIIG